MISTDEKKLKDWLTGSPMELTTFIQLSVMLTEMMYRVHQQIAFSGGLSPSNIIIHQNEKQAKLMGSVESDATYQSPEQTGCINRMPDGRSDLYTLGVLFYEMLSGQLPFEPKGEENWAFVHISVSPLPLCEIRPEWEGPLQSIILKLLAKAPEGRYQSAYGLLCDLKQCERMLEQNGTILPFGIGFSDKMSTFRIPETLFGRSAEMDQLKAGLEQASAGSSVLRLVTGYAGSGKTTLVRRLQPLVIGRGGRFVEGDCTLKQQNMPFEPILQAMRHWMEQIWSDSPATIELLKKRLNAILGQESHIIMMVLPEVKLLLNSPSDEQPLLSTEDWERFGELLPDLIRCLAESKSPQVMFIDNLQWADADTLAVLRALRHEEAVPGLMMIGAYRTESDHGLDSGNNNGNNKQVQEFPWFVSLEVRSEEQIDLHDLLYEDVRQYISDIMHEDTARIRLLARAVYHQTRGNPRSLRHLLESWKIEKKLSFDEKKHQWVWDAEVLRQLSDSEESQQLIEDSFARLSEGTMLLLAMAAAIGSSFRLTLLAKISGYTPNDTLRQLHAAELEGMICREDDTRSGERGESLYLFLHDQVHQMAYMKYAERNVEWHLKIGQQLLQDDPEWVNDMLFEAINHLNLGMEKMTWQEKQELAEHNLQTASKVLSVARFSQARHYYETGFGLVKGQEITSGSLVYKLMHGLAQCEYMCRNTELAKKLLLELKKQDGKLNRADRLSLYIDLIQIHTFDEDDKAVQFGKEALAEFGWSLQSRVSKVTLIKEVLHTQLVLKRMRDKLYRIRRNEDEDYKAISAIVQALLFALLLHNKESLLVLCASFIRYGLKKGMDEYLASIIGVYELLLQRGLPSFFESAPITNLENLQSTFHSEAIVQHRLSSIIGMSKQLENPVEASFYLEKSMYWGVESGQTAFANLAIMANLITHTGDLNELAKKLAYFEGKPRQYADDTTLRIVQVANTYRAALQDVKEQDGFVSIPIPHCKEQEQDNEDNYSCGFRLEVAYLIGRYEEALYWAKRGRESELAVDWVRIRKQRLFETLTLAAVYPEASLEEQKRIRTTIHKQLRLMSKRKGYLGASTSAHLLIKAEWDKIRGYEAGALHGYLTALKAAKAEKYGLIEGIIGERLATYYQESGSDSGAIVSLMDASTAYSAWGATAKIIQIRTVHADLLGHTLKQFESLPEEKRNESKSNGLLPQKKVEQRSSWISEDERLHQMSNWASGQDDANLLESLLATILSQAGADRGLIVKHQDNSFQIEVQTGRQLRGEGSPSYAESVLHHVLMTGESVVLGDAVQTHYMKDPYIQQQGTRSIICMPIVFPMDKHSYLLYMENTYVSDVFTKASLSRLELLVTRMTFLKILQDSEVASRESVQDVVRVSQQSLIEPLTNREGEILNALAEGLSNKEIAHSLGITEATVKTHVSNIYGKLEVKRRGQAIVRARELELLRK